VDYMERQARTLTAFVEKYQLVRQEGKDKAD
jgi:hypothetical protein